jgi:hypothetical protein
MRLDPRHLAILGLGLILGLPQASPGQPAPPDPPPASAADLDDLAQGLADEVQDLSRDIETALGRGGTVRHLAQDAQELARAIGEFQERLEQGEDRGQLRRAYAAIDSTWGHLREGIGRIAPPLELDRGIRRVDRLTDRFRLALGLAVPENLDDLAREMSEQVVHLAEDIAQDQGGTRKAVYLLQDTRELGQSLTEFRDVVRDHPDPFDVRRSYADIDQTWDQVKAALAQRGSSPAIDRSVRRIDAVDEGIRQALGLSALRPAPDARRPAGPRDEFAEARRRVGDLHDRAEALVDAMRAELGDDPGRDHVLGDARHLAERSETFEEFLGQDPSPERIRVAYASINDVATCLHDDLSRRRPPAPVLAAWRSFSESQHAINQVLDDLPAPPPTALAPLPPPPPLPPELPPQIIQAQRTIQALRQQAEALVAAMQSQLINYPGRDHVLGDASQLVERSQTFEAFLGQNPPPERIRTAYASINDVANCLYGDLSRQPPPAPVVTAWQSFSQVQHSVHQILDLPAPPPTALAPPPPLPPQPQPQPVVVLAPPSPEVINARRIALALQQRAEVLVASMRTDLHGYPNEAHVFQDAAQIAGRTESFQEFLAQNTDPQQIRAAYAPINEVATCLQGDLTRQPPPPSVLNAWQSFTQAQYLIHDTLQLPPPAPTVRVVLRPPSGPSPVVGLADQLVGETEAFLRVFGPTVRVVPEGQDFFADGQRLREAALQFRQAVAQGIDPNQLAGAFADIDATWRRLVRRTNRIARGRTGPNIQQIYKLGAIVRDIHQVLALPGYEPLIGQP